nr:DUF294 nucleotidyltransferase-like domain-containing protein [Thiomicrorhabdus aquaedulcis]
MALEQQMQFLAQISPFDVLDSAQLKLAAESLDVVYFVTGHTLKLQDPKTSDQAWLYFVIKGIVAENVGDLLIARYSVGGFIGARQLLLEATQPQNTVHQSQINHAVSTIDAQYCIVEEAILYRMPGAVFVTLMQQNTQFNSHFNASLVDKLNALHNQLQAQQSTEVMMETVCSAPMQPLVSVAATSSLLSAVQAMVAANTDACMIEFALDSLEIDASEKWGIITATEVLKSLASGDNPQLIKVGELANKPVYTVHQFDYLFNALLKMTRHQINRLVVRSDSGWLGFLHQKELMSLFANQSGLALLKIDQACSIEDLKQVTLQMDQLIASLNRKGIKMHYIAKLVGELHRKLFYKLTEWFLPQELHSKVCLLVMGSEGRFEQLIRTDQDNALLLQNDLLDQERAQVDKFAVVFNGALIELGFPNCSGNIMVTNEQWRQPIGTFIAQIDQWFDQPNTNSFINMAIFFDAQPIMGDESLLDKAKQRLRLRMQQQPMLLKHFAKSALQFETPVSFFGGLITQKNSGVERMDIKKGGIFPIVHGIRCYALKSGIYATNTHWRIKALMDKGVLDPSFGVELGESLNFLIHCVLNHN